MKDQIPDIFKNSLLIQGSLDHDYIHLPEILQGSKDLHLHHEYFVSLRKYLSDHHALSMRMHAQTVPYENLSFKAPQVVCHLTGEANWGVLSENGEIINSFNVNRNKLLHKEGAQLETLNVKKGEFVFFPSSCAFKLLSYSPDFKLLSFSKILISNYEAIEFLPDILFKHVADSFFNDIEVGDEGSLLNFTNIDVLSEEVHSKMEMLKFLKLTTKIK